MKCFMLISLTALILLANLASGEEPCDDLCRERHFIAKIDGTTGQLTACIFCHWKDCRYCTRVNGLCQDLEGPDLGTCTMIVPFVQISDDNTFCTPLCFGYPIVPASNWYESTPFPEDSNPMNFNHRVCK